jgi:C1A family cysteine protease
MQWLTLLLLPFALVHSIALPTRADVQAAFHTWQDEFKVEFHSIDEYVHRLNVFEENHVRMWVHNHFDNHTFTLGHNQFSHLTSAEFVAGFAPPHVIVRGVQGAGRALRSGAAVDPVVAVDWVAQGGVTPVKDQGQCGSCWSFSATGALEGAVFVKTGKLLSYSEQQLIDCDTQSSGCGGGLMDNAFVYVQNHGLATEAEYPYKGVATACHAPDATVVSPAVRSIVDVPPGDEHALAAAVVRGPVSVAIQANQFAFQFYKAGVLTAACGRQLDHGVLVVGYGEDAGVPYWKIKNSWGPGWGEAGYIRIERGSNKCGVADSASYPVV